MVGAGEVDEDLEVETKEECEKYGKVGKCVIFEVRDGLSGCSKSELGICLTGLACYCCTEGAKIKRSHRVICSVVILYFQYMYNTNF